MEYWIMFVVQLSMTKNGLSFLQRDVLTIGVQIHVILLSVQQLSYKVRTLFILTSRYLEWFRRAELHQLSCYWLAIRLHQPFLCEVFDCPSCSSCILAVGLVFISIFSLSKFIHDSGENAFYQEKEEQLWKPPLGNYIYFLKNCPKFQTKVIIPWREVCVKPLHGFTCFYIQNFWFLILQKSFKKFSHNLAPLFLLLKS